MICFKGCAMSLKFVHISLMVCAVLLALFGALWAWQGYEAKSEVIYLIGMVFSLAAAVGLIIYSILFFKKIKY